MSIAGLVLEMFLPGLITFFSFFIVFVNIGIININTSSNTNTTFLTLAVIIYSYLIGIVLRHLTLLKPPAHYYLIRIKKCWATLAKELIKKLNTLLIINEKCSEPLFESSELNKENIHTLISLLRDHLLSTKESSWSDYIFYQWNFARLARNTQVPLIFISSACSFCFVKGIIDKNFSSIIIYSFASTLSVIIALLISKVYRERLFWHVDILMRTILMDLWYKNNNPQIENMKFKEKRTK